MVQFVNGRLHSMGIVWIEQLGEIYYADGEERFVYLLRNLEKDIFS